MAKLRVGIVGLGGIANGAHLPALKKIDEVEIVAICDIRQEKIDACIERQGFPKDIKQYIRYQDMMDNEQLDLVHICTPNCFHSEIACYGLKKGINMLSEKPESMTVEQVLAIKAAQDESGKRFMAIRNNRYRYGSSVIKKMVDSGEMGDIYAARCGYIRRRGIPGMGGWFTTKAMSGGGPVIDLGVHMIDLTMFLMGNHKAVSVSGCTYTKFGMNEDKSDSIHSAFGEKVENGTFDVEDLAMGFIKFENGACLQIEFSWASNIKKEEQFSELRGTKLGARWSSGFYEIYDGTKKNSKLKTWLSYASQATKYRSSHYENIKHYVDVIQGRAEPMYTIDQGINMIKILCAIYESAATGKEIVL